VGVPQEGFGLRHINMFWSLAQTRVVISDWKADYDHRRRSPWVVELLRDVV